MVLVQLDEADRGITQAYLPEVNDRYDDDDDDDDTSSTFSGISCTSSYTYELPDGTVTTSYTVPILKDGEKVIINRKRPSTTGKKKKKAIDPPSSTLSTPATPAASTSKLLKNFISGASSSKVKSPASNTSNSHNNSSNSNGLNLTTINEVNSEVTTSSSSHTRDDLLIFDYDGPFVANVSNNSPPPLNYQPGQYHHSDINYETTTATTTAFNDVEAMDEDDASFVNIRRAAGSNPGTAGSTTSSNTNKSTTSSSDNRRRSSRSSRQKKQQQPQLPGGNGPPEYDEYDYDACLRLAGDFDATYERMQHLQNSSGPKNVFLNNNNNAATKKKVESTPFSTGILPLRTTVFSRSAAAGNVAAFFPSKSTTTNYNKNGGGSAIGTTTSSNSGSTHKRSGFDNNGDDEEDDFLQEVSLDPNGNTAGHNVTRSSEYYSDIQYHADILHRNNHRRRRGQITPQRFISTLRSNPRMAYGCAFLVLAFIVTVATLLGVILSKDHNNKNTITTNVNANDAVDTSTGNYGSPPTSSTPTGSVDNGNNNGNNAGDNNNSNSDNNTGDNSNNDTGDQSNSSPVSSPTTQILIPTIYIDSGHNDPYVDTYVSGRQWIPDTRFVVNSTDAVIYYGCDVNDFVKMNLFANADNDGDNTTAVSVEKTRIKPGGEVWDPELFCTERWFYHTGEYKIPIDYAGTATYKVSLYFNELFFSQTGERTFDVIVEGHHIKNDFDIFNAADGQYTVVVLESYHIISDGILSIELIPTGKMNHPKISAVVIQMESANADQAMDSKITMRKIQHPSFVVKAVNGKGEEIKKNQADGNKTADNQDTNGQVDDVIMAQLDDGIVNDISDQDNTPTYSPTETNFPTQWVANDDAIGSNTTNTYTKDNFNSDFNMLDENSVHINVGQDGPYKRSASTNLMWFDDGQFIRSEDKGFVLGDCDGTQNITGITEFSKDTFVGCKERIFDTTGTYEIPLPVNIEETITFNVTLYFAEMFFSEVGQRVFDVAIEGQIVFNDFDIVKQAQAKNTWYTISRPVVVPDGLLDISLISKINHAKIDAIIVHPIYNYDGISSKNP